MQEKYGLIIEATVNKFKKSMSQAKEIVSSVKEVFDNAKQDFDLGFSMNVEESKQELIELRKELEKTEEEWKQIQEKFSKAKAIPSQDLTEKYEGKIEKTKGYINELEDKLDNVGSSFFGKLGIVSKNIKDTFKDAGDTIKQNFNNKLEETENEFDNLNEKTKKIDLTGMFKRGTKSLKRFALSLFGIQSIWRVLSKASSTYLSQNKELASKIQSVWSGLGTLIGPIVDFLADIFLKFIGYINVMTKALFNFDIIAKANANTLKKYREQMKSFGGIDELTNLSSDKGPQGLINEDDLGLDEGIVKKLQELSYWLKDNWNWLKLVAEGLALAFGVSVIGGLLSNIGKLIGSASLGTGLAGLSSLLFGIVGLGAITIGITMLITKKYSDDLQDSLEQNEELDNQTYDIVTGESKKASSYKKGSKELNAYINKLKEEIEVNAINIRQAEDQLTSYGLIDGMIAQIHGDYQKYQDEIEISTNRIDKLIEAYKKEYDAGKLNAEQERYYIELIKTKNEMIKKSGTMYSTYTQNYAGLTRQNIENTINVNNQVKSAINGIQNFYEKQLDVLANYFGVSKDKLSSVLTNLSDEMKEKLNKKFNINIDTIIDKTGIDEATKSVQNYKKEADNTFSKKYTSIIDVIFKTDGIKDLFKGLFTGEYSLSGIIQKIFSSGNNDLKQYIKDFVNNNIIDKINEIKILGIKLNIPHLAIGTDNVKNDGLAYLHAGEKVVPADVASGGYTEDNGETNNLLRTLIEVIQEKEFSANISQNDIGKASVNYIRNQNRIMGGSVI